MNIFKKTLLHNIRPSGSAAFNCHNLKGFKLSTRLRLGLSNLCEHSSFSLNPICSCGKDILLHCPNHSNERYIFLNIIGSIHMNILTRIDFQVTETLLYGDSNSNKITYTLILNAKIDFIIYMNYIVPCILIILLTFS